MREIYKISDLKMGWKHTIELLERIQDEGLTDEIKELIPKEIIKFYERKGNMEAFTNSF